MGFPALDIWDNLAWEAKEKMVAQVARDLMSIFELRFTMAGSLYLTSDQEYIVGPIVDPKYFETMDGQPVYTDSCVQQSLHQFRGPFSNATDWLSSSMKAEMFALSRTPSPFPLQVGGRRPRDLPLTMKIMSQAISLCSIYPGNHPIINSRKASKSPFSFMFDDFSLSNIMVWCLCSGYCNFNLLPLSYSSTELVTLLDTSISKLQRLFLCGNAPPYQNGCKLKATTTDGLKAVGLNLISSCCAPFFSEKLVIIWLVMIGEKPTRRAFFSEISRGNWDPVPLFGSMTVNGWRSVLRGLRNIQE
jgi:hypothetical protein